MRQPCSLLKATTKRIFQISKSRSFVMAANWTHDDATFLRQYDFRNIIIEVHKVSGHSVYIYIYIYICITFDRKSCIK
jgi:hypothetical protein